MCTVRFPVYFRTQWLSLFRVLILALFALVQALVILVQALVVLVEAHPPQNLLHGSQGGLI